MKWMFLGALNFNADLSPWDMSSITRTDMMFQGATKFDQNLCAWGENGYNYDTVDDMFDASGCTYKSDPRQVLKGPFCASECSSDSQQSQGPSNSQPDSQEDQGSSASQIAHIQGKNSIAIILGGYVLQYILIR